MRFPIYKPLAYVSLPHSGTGFVLDSLFRGNWIELNSDEATSGKWPAAFAHITLENEAWLDAELPKYECVVSSRRVGMRHSWEKRRPWALPYLEGFLQRLKHITERHDVITLDLDDERGRAMALAEINSRCGLTLSTDWAPRISWGDMPQLRPELRSDVRLR